MNKVNVTLTRLAQRDPVLLGKDLEEVFELLAKEILNLKRQVKILMKNN